LASAAGIGQTLRIQFGNPYLSGEKLGSSLTEKPRGRPTSFNEKVKLRILELAAEGRTDAQIAKAVGVSRVTLHNWKGAYPDFLSALKDAKDVADQLVMASLFQRACGYSHPAIKFFMTKTGEIVSKRYTEHYPPDVMAGMYWLNNRRPKKWGRNGNRDQQGNPDDAQAIGVAYKPKSLREVKECG
jgi:hypothetical protein